MFSNELLSNSPIDIHGILVSGIHSMKGIFENNTSEVETPTRYQTEPVITVLKEKEIKPPEVGFEIQGAQSEIIGEAELVWASQKIAIIGENQIEYLSNFESMGWSVYKINEWQEMSTEIVRRLSK